jgi:hypothetical protein
VYSVHVRYKGQWREAHRSNDAGSQSNVFGEGRFVDAVLFPLGGEHELARLLANDVCMLDDAAMC